MAEQENKKVEFKDIKSEEIEFGKNSFLEIARKVAITDESENEFISISRGFYLPDGNKRYKNRNVSVPSDSDLLKKISKIISNI